MKVDESVAMRAVLWGIPLLTIGIFVLDLLTPVGIAVSILYVIPLLLTAFRASERESFYFCGLATSLLWVGLFLKPPGSSFLYGVLNRTLGTAVLWILALGLVRFRRLRQQAGETGQALMVARVERAHAEGLMMAAQEARSHADMAALGAATSHREAETRYQISQLRLESIIGSAMDAIITVDEGQTIVLFNRAAEQMFAYSVQEAVGQPLDRFIPTQFREAHRHHVQAFGQSGVTSRKMGQLGTVMGLRSTGEEFPMEAAISHIAVEGKKYYTVILRDISERKRVEEDLRESQRQLITLIGNLPGFAYRSQHDRNWAFEYLSAGVSELTGHTADEYLVQRNVSYGEHIHPDDREHVWQEVQTAVKHRRPFEMTYRILSKSSDVKWVWERGEGIYALDGSIRYLEGFVTDITERKRAEHLLRQSEERYRRLIAVSPYAIVVNRGGRIIFANDQAIKLFGAVRTDEILGKSPLDLVHPDYHDVIRERMHELLEGRQIVPVIEEKIVRLDGTSLDVEVSAARLADEEGPAILTMFRDISERKRLQEQLRKTERVAELGTLASGMAHEIGTPMNVILGRAEYLLDRVTEEPIKKGLQTIIGQVERITRVMNQLLSFARRKAPERAALDLKQVIEDSLEMFQERLERSKVQVVTAFAKDCPIVEADRDQMSQVLINLVMNAVHAMPNGGTLRIELGSDKQMLRLSISDTGHGIPQDVMKKVFEPFFTTKEFGQGTGLGLTVVKGIIEEHQGSIAVESEEGKGTTFTILLPTTDSKM